MLQASHRRHNLLKHTHDTFDVAVTFSQPTNFTAAASASIPPIRIGTTSDSFASGALTQLGLAAAGATTLAVRNETDNVEAFLGVGTATAKMGAVTNHALEFYANNTLFVTITADGRLYGAALHNNAGAVTGTTNQYIASGTYTPTLTNVANISASTAYVAQWIRVGNVVTVSGRVDVDAVAATTQTTLGMSLPIASDFAANEQCGGAAIANAVAGSFNIHADTTNNRANFSTVDINSTANTAFWFTFTYLIV